MTLSKPRRQGSNKSFSTGAYVFKNSSLGMFQSNYFFSLPVRVTMESFLENSKEIIFAFWKFQIMCLCGGKSRRGSSKIYFVLKTEGNIETSIYSLKLKSIIEKLSYVNNWVA